MADTTDTDDLTPAGEGTPLGEAEPSREWKDERIKELGGVVPSESCSEYRVKIGYEPTTERTHATTEVEVWAKNPTHAESVAEGVVSSVLSAGRVFTASAAKIE